MIEKMAELNRVLIATTEMSDEKQGANYESVIKQCRSTAIEARTPNHQLSIEFAQQIGLLKTIDNRIFITNHGEEFLSFNSIRRYNLSNDQARFLIRICYLHGNLRSKTLNLLKRFYPDYNNKTFRFSIDKNIIDKEQQWLLDHLVQLNLLTRCESTIKVNSNYVGTIASFLAEGKGWSEESLEEYLKERKELGDLAEQLILKFEKDRLIKLKCDVESSCVRQISKLRVDAGYDVDSFNDKATDLNYNRFIEIKGAKDTKVRFFWSNNEMKTAKKLGDKYWIYFQGGIDLENKKAKTEPLLFKNPIETILKNPVFKITPQGVMVESNTQGKLIRTA